VPSWIESLTPEQERQLVAYRDEWLAVGRSCAPADRVPAERALKAMYRILGRAEPYVWWCDGPAVGSMVRTLIRDFKGANLWDNLWANLWDNLGANLRANLRDNLRANLGANLRDNLGANLGANLRDNLRDNLWANLEWGFWGAHEAHWPAYVNWPHIALREIHTADQMVRLNLWLDLARSVGWWHPFEGIVFACDRPARQAIDEQGRLHHPTEAAFICRDGWQFHAWHGVRIPGEWIERKADVDPRLALTHDNIEQRRALAEILGWERVLQQLAPRVINADADPQIGTLMEVELPDAGKTRFLRVRCGTGRDFVLCVPREMKTALQAAAWTYDLKPDEYAPQLRT